MTKTQKQNKIKQLSKEIRQQASNELNNLKNQCIRDLQQQGYIYGRKI